MKFKWLYVVFLFSVVQTMEPIETTSRLLPSLRHFKSILAVDGSYSQCATLANRLHLIHLSTHQMSWRYLWNHMSILVLALDTLQPSRLAIVRWKTELNTMISRIQRAQLPGLNNAYDHQVDSQMVLMVHEHLAKLLIPTNKMTQFITLEFFVAQQRQYGTTQMFRSVFEYWDAPVVMIQLLARSYLPYLYLLHTVHDANHVQDYELITTFYSPIHQCIVDMEAFSEVGNKEDYETALTYVDSHLMH